jgi:hypothetical protein
MLAAKWLHRALYRISLFQIKHYNSVLEYLVDIRSKDWLKLFWECINGKLFTVRFKLQRQSLAGKKLPLTWKEFISQSEGEKFSSYLQACIVISKEYVTIIYIIIFIFISSSIICIMLLNLHCKKSFTIFPSPAGMSLTKLSLAGKNSIIPGQRMFG